MNPNNRKKFFNNLALEMGLTSDDQAMKYYYDFVRLIVRTANNEERIKLPDLGDFKVILRKGRKSSISGLDGACSREANEVYIPPKRTMQFYPDKKVKDHLNRYMDDKIATML